MKMLQLLMSFVMMGFLGCTSDKAPELPPGHTQVFETDQSPEHFKAQVKEFTSRLKNIQNEKFYAKWSSVNVETGEKIEFKDLTEIQREAFYLFQGEVLGLHLRSAEIQWNLILAGRANKAEDKKAEAEDKAEDKTEGKVATNEELNGFIMNVHNLRGETALRHLTMIADMKKKYEDNKEYPTLSKELGVYHDRMRNLYSKDKLIVTSEGEE